MFAFYMTLMLYSSARPDGAQGSGDARGCLDGDDVGCGPQKVKD